MPSMRVSHRLVTTIEQFRDLEPAWDGLLAQSGSSPFLTWAWMYTWWEQYCRAGRRRTLAIVVQTEDEAVTGILPGYIRHGGPLGPSSYSFLGTEFESTDYLHVIAPRAERSRISGEMFLWLHREVGVDLLDLANILSSDPLLAVLESVAGTTGAAYEARPHKTCPYISIATDWDAYLGQLSAKMRKNVRRSTRMLVDAGARLEPVTRRDDVRGAVLELFELHARRFQAKNAPTKFVAHTRAAFHQAVSERFFDRDMLRLFRLRVGESTIASLYCFEYDNALYYFQSGIDPEWDRESAGTVLVGLAIKYACDRGLSLFDFMRGEEAYKFRWTNTTRQIVVARMSASFIGRIALAADGGIHSAKAVVKGLVAPKPQPAAPADADA